MQTLNFPLLISSAVAIVLHMALFSILILSSSFPAAIPPKKILVRTVRLNPQKKITASQSLPLKEEPQGQEKQEPLPQQKKEAQKPEPKVQPSAQKKKETLKPPPKKEVAKKPAVKQSVVKPASDHKKNALLAKAQESLKKIGDAKSIEKASIANIAPLQSLELITNEPISENEIAYRDELAHYLKALLRLPEIGEINLKLTIALDGTIKTVEILSSESTSNRKYVEKTLPQHTMPALGKQFGNVDSYTFTITMKGV